MSRRVPPHSVDMEDAVIGCMLLGDTDLPLGLLSCGDFYQPRDAAIFEAFERLAEDGSPLEAELVAERSGLPLGLLNGLKFTTPAAQSTSSYARIVAELGALRRAIALGEQLIDASYARNADEVDRLLADPMARLLPNFVSLAPPRRAGGLDEPGEPEWLVPRLLARGELVLWVGEPGWGKSTLLRQFSVLCSRGLHPWTRVPLPAPLRVLYVDCQESWGKAHRAFRCLQGNAEPLVWLQCRPNGLDLTVPRDQRWLDQQVAETHADLVVLGPLYNAIRGAPGRSKQSEETAELAKDALLGIMARRDCALMIEAHAPHGDELRVRGSKLWEDWADFGFGLKSSGKPTDRVMDVVRFRGDRDADREWPTRYVRGSRWPWEAVSSRIEQEAMA